MSGFGKLARRFVTVSAWSLWLGGLTFYALVVIPAGHKVIPSHSTFGFVTQKVTLALNAIGTVAIAVLLLNGAASWKTAGVRSRWGMAAAWILMAAAHVSLYPLHSRLDAMLDFPAKQVQSGAPFFRWHEIYLIFTAVEWGAGLLYLWSCLAAWRGEDRLSSDRT